jgi:hypothetical protein
MNIDFIDILIASLCVWRLAHMIKYEAGPWDIFIRIRERLGTGMLGKLMDCIWCSSVWLAIIYFVPGTKYLVILLAISGLAILLEGLHVLLWRSKEKTITNSGISPIYRDLFRIKPDV